MDRKAVASLVWQVGQKGDHATASVPPDADINGKFMDLLVNVVQLNWQKRNVEDRIRALRCLLFILRGLSPSEASRYYRHIMATYNSAMSSSDEAPESEETACVKFLAVQALREYIKKLAEQQWEFLATNLDAVVVSLFPVVLDCSKGEKASSEALSMLEWLVTGEIGKKLANSFSQIPFLPSCAAFDPMRESLRKHGVDFDSYVSTSEGGSTRSDKKAAKQKENALKQRLETMCKLLSNENIGVRRIVLQHLTELLRGNRELFGALVENELDTSMKHYVAVAYKGTLGSSRGTVTDLIEALLSRSTTETDQEVSILLATCLGEVGAIGNYHLEECSHDLPKPGPWCSESLSKYGLTLVTNYLVAALKAAQVSDDDLKIALTIQQLLSLLDKFASAGGSAKRPVPTSSDQKKEMSVWLSKELQKAGVRDTVERFWWTNYSMSDQPIATYQPYFALSGTYYGWISDWTRFMVLRSQDAKNGKWKELFYACRSAVRTPVGLGVAEYLLPVLVLDRICFGDGHDEQTVLNEMHSALSFGPESKCKMSHSERQKAVNTVLNVIDTFQLWSASELAASGASNTSDDWPLKESFTRINDVLQAIPLSLRASAASSVGMHARALRLFEMLARSQVAAQVFDATLASAATNGSTESPPNKPTRSRAAGVYTEPTIRQVLGILVALKEYETTEYLGEDENIDSLAVRIKRKEASLDWQGAFQDYQLALTLGGGDVHHLRSGALRCSLELGHFDSVLYQVKGLMKAFQEEIMSESLEDTIQIGIEATRRLGDWDELSKLMSEISRESDSYESSLGRVMLCLKNRDKENALIGIRQARKAVMDKLSIATGSGRANESIVELQGLREIEDVVQAVCCTHPLNLSGYIAENGLSWDRRLELVNSSSAAGKILDVRLALARLAGDATFEGSLFLNMGRRERKKGSHGMAASALAQSEAAFARVNLASTRCETLSHLKLQFAKLKYDTGQTSAALRMLQTEDVDSDSLIDFDRDAVVTEARKRVVSLSGSKDHSMREDQVLRVFAKNMLQSTQWMVEGGLKDGSEIISRYRLLQKVDPKWEKGHFCFAKYLDSSLQSRKAAVLSHSPEQFTGVSDDIIQGIAVSQDSICQRYVVQAMEHYVHALSLSSKHIYQALPRLLSLWFEFTSIGKTELSPTPSDSQLRKELTDKQFEANIFMADHFEQIPASYFYTAMPQLISRITHADKATASIVKNILIYVLHHWPAQAMWPLAWLRHSIQSERRAIGNEIFEEAARLLEKGPNPRFAVLLRSSKRLFSYLKELAEYNPGKSCEEYHVKPYKPFQGEADLSEYIPPTQAALSASFSCGDSGLARDLFPRHVPRMRKFSSKVQILGSKARPKILKAFVVSSDSANTFWSKNGKGSFGKEHDIGEIQFLVKQEQKGDLRKDARVQDLNNVINRLMATAASDGASGSARRLSLRTFAVTCLSEDSGILEWVPDTAALGSLVRNTYNPLAPQRHLPSDKEGRRIYEKKCQPMYFEHGHLRNAANLFEKLCVKSPPLLYWWFVQTFPDPHTWYEARTRFVLSSAVWSAVGHVVGLGDRHTSNILVDKGSGECVHVDFDCIFDKGLYLPKPEVVPFRLTQNMLDAFGPTGADGLFTSNLKCAMSTLRDNRDTLLSVLEPFLNDPIIDWKRYRSQQQQVSGSSSSSNKQGASEDRQTKEAKRSISVIDERLRGIYNLRNPNLQRIKRSDGVMTHEDSELSHMLPLSVEGQVHKMIAEATSSENLVQMYAGWMPWI